MKVTISEKSPIVRAAAKKACCTFAAVCLVSIALLVPHKNLAQQKDSRPNIVFILADDLGWTDLGCYGSDFYETPNLDRLAAGGMRFTDAYAACPVCSPTRSSILTGKYPARTANTDWFGAPQPDNLADKWKSKPLLPAPYQEYMALEEKTIAEALKESGYATFFAGKWHLGPNEKYWPMAQGFDINKGGHEAGSPRGEGRYFLPYGNPRLENGPRGEYLPLRLGEETAKFIEANQDRPFLAYLSFYSVHTPLMTTPALEAKYKQKKERLGLEDKWGTEGERKVRLVQCHPIYAGMVEAMDRAVGIVLDKLKALGLEENTVIVFTADNGGLSTSEGHPTSNLPLRAGKGWLYEGGIREPMIIRWPRVVKAGSVCATPVTSTDFYPTLLDVSGLPGNRGQHRDGTSLVNLLEGKDKLNRKAIFWHYPHYGNQGGSPGSAMRADNWKLIWWYENDRLELYNLKEDIGEKNNLASVEAERVKQMKRQLDRWLASVDARMPTRNPDYPRE